ncbi:helix-turn-helix domain-containing protein [uncultured Arenimonas sp.]|uniref:helix-turn-helix domain-containing protein n=1 Tax=uncultured Arenimonas sp. TaxID=546226 RepID=UPI0030D837EA
MSIEAVNLVFRQNLRPSGTKFVLVALADCADITGLCWPSVDHLCDITSQDRKTVLGALKRLRTEGWIEDTGKRRGRTHQIVVWRLDLDKLAKGKAMFHAERKRAETGTLSADPASASLGKDAESGTVPNSDALETKLGAALPGVSEETVPKAEQYRFRPETVPESGHGTTRELQAGGGCAHVSAYLREREGRLHDLTEFDRNLVTPYLDRLTLPIDPQLLAEFVKHRQVMRRPLSISAWTQTKRDLQALADDGVDPNDAIREALSLGLSKPVRPGRGPARQNANRPRVSDDFAGVHYASTDLADLPEDLQPETSHAD